MKLSLNEATILPYDVETFINAAGKVGFEGVELRIEKIEEFLKDKRTTDLVELLGAYKLELVSLNAIDSFSLLPRQEFQKLLGKADEIMKVCSKIGCDKVIAVPSLLPLQIKRWSIIEKTSKALRKLARLGADYGVKVAFEFLGFENSSVKTLEESLKVLVMSDLENVGLVVDTFHLHISNSPLETLKALPVERLWIIHINDSEDRPLKELRDKHRLLPGEGVINLDLIIKILKAMNYGDYLSVELFNEEYWKQNPYEVAKKALESLTRLNL